VKPSRRGQRGKTDGSYASNNPRLSAFMVLTLGSREKDDVPGCGPRATGRVRDDGGQAPSRRHRVKPP
jgi:hypothetical protein